ncbi:NDR1/HIN1-like 3 [Prunus dulcis]|uniref:NDR1/HIN1-like 3 n=1 Tax=Prunus dulcis TaxID=3755 RepID=A0A4Y1RV84_PRUDU|nr:NDR1/HIN1-like 3 [Prunus dulcis]
MTPPLGRKDALEPMTPRFGARCLFCFCNTILCLLLALFIFWLIFLPKEPEFTVSNASLTQFNFNNNTLYYNLALNITIQNPNKRVGIYYRHIQVIANYRKERFSMVNLTSPPFYQGHKNTTFLHDVLVEGQELVEFGEHELSQFNSETAAAFTILMYGKFKTADYGSSKIDCKLKVPLSFSETPATGFNTTKCCNVYVLTNP